MSKIDYHKWFKSNNIKYIDYNEFTEDENEKEFIGKDAFEKVNSAERKNFWIKVAMKRLNTSVMKEIAKEFC